MFFAIRTALLTEDVNTRMQLSMLKASSSINSTALQAQIDGEVQEIADKTNNITPIINKNRNFAIVGGFLTLTCTIALYATRYLNPPAAGFLCLWYGFESM
jgi:hypothetical protein